MSIKKKYYLLFVWFLLGSFAMPAYLQAKPTASQTAVQNNQSDSNDSSTPSDTSNDSIVFPKVNKIQFAGNTSIPSEILQKAISLKVNDIANQVRIMDSMIKIAQIYKEKNIKITIDPILEKNTINSRNIIFKIHEMPIKEK